MFEPFSIPPSIEAELVDFFRRQPTFPLSLIDARKMSVEEALYRQGLSRHYGVYVLYYTGVYPLYTDIADLNRAEMRKPIYVGKAVSRGSRIGHRQGRPALSSGTEDDETSIETAQLTLAGNPDKPLSNHLFKRLNEHANNIRKTNNLDVADFKVRVIPMADALVQWAEAVMIKRLKPVWNARISGFGNHDPGSGRYEQARSIWDQLHPGRIWSLKLSKLTPYDEQTLRSSIRMNLDVDLND